MGSETRYSQRQYGPVILERGQNQSLNCPVYLAGALVAPSGATVSVFDPTGAAVVDTASASIVSSIATYSLSSSVLASRTPETGWRVEWSLTISGAVHRFRSDAALVHRRLYPVISDEDLYQLHSGLSRRLPSGQASWQDKIDTAFGELEGRLIELGIRPWLILAPSALRRAHLALTLSRIFADLAEGSTDTAESATADSYRQEYQAAFAGLTFPQAEPDTGNPAGQKRLSGRPSVWLCSREPV
jgi:hypothetical protein